MSLFSVTKSTIDEFLRSHTRDEIAEMINDKTNIKAIHHLLVTNKLLYRILKHFYRNDIINTVITDLTLLFVNDDSINNNTFLTAYFELLWLNHTGEKLHLEKLILDKFINKIFPKNDTNKQYNAIIHRYIDIYIYYFETCNFDINDLLIGCVNDYTFNYIDNVIDICLDIIKFCKSDVKYEEYKKDSINIILDILYTIPESIFIQLIEDQTTLWCVITKIDNDEINTYIINRLNIYEDSSSKYIDGYVNILASLYKLHNDKLILNKIESYFNNLFENIMKTQNLYIIY